MKYLWFLNLKKYPGLSVPYLCWIGMAIEIGPVIAALLVVAAACTAMIVVN